MALKLANNAVALLAAAVTTTDTTIALTPGAGAKFPTLTAGDWFPATLVKSTGALEVVKVTARSGDVLTVERAQEGTAAASFNPGDRIEHRLTKGALEAILADIAARLPQSGGTISGDLTLSRQASPGTGVVFLGNSGARYLHYDGSNYVMPGAALYVNGSAVWTAGNFNPGNYMPLSGGTFSGNFTIQNTSPQINFYDTDWGWRYLHCNGGNIGFLTSGGGWAVYSDNAGNLIASGNVGAYSDRRHKTDISTIDSALALVERLRGVRYTDQRTGQRRVGVIAQEVQEVVPEVVGEGPDGLHVDYGNLVALAIEAIKELAGEVRMSRRGL